MHAILQPSSAHRWVHCPGSVKAEEQYPDVENEEAREGTAAHEIAAELVKRASVAKPYSWNDFEGRSATNGVLFNEEMYEAAEIYADDCRKVMISTGCFQPNIEQPVMIPRVHELNWGTYDFMIHQPLKFKIVITDFKYGRKPVELVENWQLIEYGIGVIDEITGGSGIADQNYTIELRLVQPRAFHIDGVCRNWIVKASDLRGYANQLKSAADLSQTDNPPTTAGEWCRYCSASRGCMTLQKEAACITERVETLQLHDLSPEARSIELKYLQRSSEILKERLSSLEDQALELAKQGELTPGYGIGYGRGATVWNKPDSEVIALGDLLGVNLRKDESPITPTQALKKDIDEAVIKDYSTHEDGKARLVTDNKTIAGRVFKN